MEKNKLSKRILSMMLAMLIVFGLFVSTGILTVAAATDSAPNDVEILGTHDTNTPGFDVDPAIPLVYNEDSKKMVEMLQPGEVWTGKKVTYNGSGVFTITLSAWGATYNVNAKGETVANKNPMNGNLLVTDEIGADFIFVAESKVGSVGTFSETDGRVTWTLANGDITKSAPISVSFKVSLKSTITNTIPWYPTNKRAGAAFKAADDNPYYRSYTVIKENSPVYSGELNWNNSGDTNSLNQFNLYLGGTMVLSCGGNVYNKGWVSYSEFIRLTTTNTQPPNLASNKEWSKVIYNDKSVKGSGSDKVYTIVAAVWNAQTKTYTVYGNIQDPIAANNGGNTLKEGNKYNFWQEIVISENLQWTNGADSNGNVAFTMKNKGEIKLKNPAPPTITYTIKYWKNVQGSSDSDPNYLGKVDETGEEGETIILDDDQLNAMKTQDDLNDDPVYYYDGVSDPEDGIELVIDGDNVIHVIYKPKPTYTIRYWQDQKGEDESDGNFLDKFDRKLISGGTNLTSEKINNDRGVTDWINWQKDIEDSKLDSKFNWTAKIYYDKSAPASVWSGITIGTEGEYIIDIVYTPNLTGYTVNYWQDDMEGTPIVTFEFDGKTVGTELSTNEIIESLQNDPKSDGEKDDWNWLTIEQPEYYGVGVALKTSINPLDKDASKNVINVIYIRQTTSYKIRYWKDSIDADGDNQIGQFIPEGTVNLGTTLNDKMITDDMGEDEGFDWVNAQKTDDNLANADYWADGKIYEGNIQTVNWSEHLFDSTEEYVIDVLYTPKTTNYEIRYWHDKKEIEGNQIGEIFTSQESSLGTKVDSDKITSDMGKDEGFDWINAPERIKELDSDFYWNKGKIYVDGDLVESWEYLTLTREDPYVVIDVVYIPKPTDYTIKYWEEIEGEDGTATWVALRGNENLPLSDSVNNQFVGDVVSLALDDDRITANTPGGAYLYDVSVYYPDRENIDSIKLNKDATKNVINVVYKKQTTSYTIMYWKNSVGDTNLGEEQTNGYINEIVNISDKLDTKKDSIANHQYYENGVIDDKSTVSFTDEDDCKFKLVKDPVNNVIHIVYVPKTASYTIRYWKSEVESGNQLSEDFTQSVNLGATLNDKMITDDMQAEVGFDWVNAQKTAANLGTVTYWENGQIYVGLDLQNPLEEYTFKASGENYVIDVVYEPKTTTYIIRYWKYDARTSTNKIGADFISKELPLGTEMNSNKIILDMGKQNVSGFDWINDSARRNKLDSKFSWSRGNMYVGEDYINPVNWTNESTFALIAEAPYIIDIVYTPNPTSYTVNYWQDDMSGIPLATYTIEDKTTASSLPTNTIIADLKVKLGVSENNINWNWLTVSQPMYYNVGIADETSIRSLDKDASKNVINVIYTKQTASYTVRYWKNEVRAGNQLGEDFTQSINLGMTLNDKMITDDMREEVGFNWVNAQKTAANLGTVAYWENGQIYVGNQNQTSLTPRMFVTPNENHIIDVVYTLKTTSYEIRYWQYDKDNEDNQIGETFTNNNVSLGTKVDSAKITSAMEKSNGFDWINAEKIGLTEKFNWENGVVYIDGIEVDSWEVYALILQEVRTYKIDVVYIPKLTAYTIKYWEEDMQSGHLLGIDSTNVNQTVGISVALTDDQIQAMIPKSEYSYIVSEVLYDPFNSTNASITLDKDISKNVINVIYTKQTASYTIRYWKNEVGVGNQLSNNFTQSVYLGTTLNDKMITDAMGKAGDFNWVNSQKTAENLGVVDYWENGQIYVDDIFNPNWMAHKFMTPNENYIIDIIYTPKTTTYIIRYWYDEKEIQGNQIDGDFISNNVSLGTKVNNAKIISDREAQGFAGDWIDAPERTSKLSGDFYWNVGKVYVNGKPGNWMNTSEITLTKEESYVVIDVVYTPKLTTYTIKYWEEDMQAGHLLGTDSTNVNQIVGIPVSLNENQIAAKMPVNDYSYISAAYYTNSDSAATSITLHKDALNNVINVIYTKKTTSYKIIYWEEDENGDRKQIGEAVVVEDQLIGSTVDGDDIKDCKPDDTYSGGVADKDIPHKLVENPDNNVINVIYTKQTTVYEVIYWQVDENGNKSRIGSIFEESQPVGKQVTINIDYLRPATYSKGVIDTLETTATVTSNRFTLEKVQSKNVVHIVYTKQTTVYEVIYWQVDENGNKSRIGSIFEESQPVGKQVTINVDYLRPATYSKGVIDTLETTAIVTSTGFTLGLASEDNVVHILYTKQTTSYTVVYWQVDENGSKAQIGEPVVGANQPVGNEITLTYSEINKRRPNTYSEGDPTPAGAALTLVKNSEVNVINIVYTKQTTSYTIRYWTEDETGHRIPINGVAVDVGNKPVGNRIDNGEVIADNGDDWININRPAIPSDPDQANCYWENGEIFINETKKSRETFSLILEADATQNVINVVYKYVYNDPDFKSLEMEKTVARGNGSYGLDRDVTYTVDYTIAIRNPNTFGDYSVTGPLSDTMFSNGTATDIRINGVSATLNLEKTLTVTVSAGQTVYVTYTVAFTAKLKPQTINNTATFKYNDKDGGRNRLRDRAKVDIPKREPVKEALEITKSVVDSPIKSGESAVFEIVVTNSGEKAQKITLVDVFDYDAIDFSRANVVATSTFSRRTIDVTGQFTIYGGETITITYTTEPLFNIYNPVSGALNKEIAKLQAELDGNTEETGLTAQYEAVETAYNKAGQAYSDLMAAINELQGIIENLQNEISSLQNAKITLEEAAANQGEDLTDTEDFADGEIQLEYIEVLPGIELQLTDIEEQLALAEAEFIKHSEQMNIYQAQLLENVDIADLKETLDALEAQINLINNKINELRDKIPSSDQTGEIKKFVNVATIYDENGNSIGEDGEIVEVIPIAEGAATIVKEVQAANGDWVKQIEIDAYTRSAIFRLTITNQSDDEPVMVKLDDYFVYSSDTSSKNRVNIVDVDYDGTLTLNPGETKEFFVKVSFGENYAYESRTILNTANITDIYDENSGDSSNATVIQDPRPKAVLSVTKEVVDGKGSDMWTGKVDAETGSPLLAHGNTITYKITVANHGNRNAWVNISDVFSVNDEVLYNNDIFVAAGMEESVYVTKTAENKTDDNIHFKNIALITSSEEDTIITDSKDEADVTVTPEPYIELSVIKKVAKYVEGIDYEDYYFAANNIDTPLQMAHGSRALYQIIVTNLGNAEAIVNIEDKFEGTPVALIDKNGNKVNNPVTIADGDSVTLYYLSNELSGNPVGNKLKVYRNNVTVSGEDARIDDRTDKENEKDTDDAYVIVEETYTELSVTKKVAEYSEELNYETHKFEANTINNPLQMAHGSKALYQITINNNGNIEAHINVRDVFGDEIVTLLYKDGSLASNEIIIPAGGYVKLYYLSGKLSGSYEGNDDTVYANTVTVTEIEAGDNVTDDAYVTVTPEPYIELSVIKKVAQYNGGEYASHFFTSTREAFLVIDNGSRALYQITIQNHGNTAAMVTITDMFDSEDIEIVDGNIVNIPAAADEIPGEVVIYYLSRALVGSTSGVTTYKNVVRISAGGEVENRGTQTEDEADVIIPKIGVYAVTVRYFDTDGNRLQADRILSTELLNGNNYNASALFIQSIGLYNYSYTRGDDISGIIANANVRIDLIYAYSPPTPTYPEPEDEPSLPEGDDDEQSDAPQYAPPAEAIEATISYEAEVYYPDNTNEPLVYEQVIETPQEVIEPTANTPEPVVEEVFEEEETPQSAPDFPQIDNTASVETEAKKIMEEILEDIDDDEIPIDAPDLPKTGGLSGILMALAGLGLFGAGTILNKKKKDDDGQ